MINKRTSITSQDYPPSSSDSNTSLTVHHRGHIPILGAHLTFPALILLIFRVISSPCHSSNNLLEMTRMYLFVVGKLRISTAHYPVTSVWGPGRHIPFCGGRRSVLGRRGSWRLEDWQSWRRWRRPCYRRCGETLYCSTWSSRCLPATPHDMCVISDKHDE